MDILNEFEPATTAGAGWGAYLGMDAGSYALGLANLYKGKCQTYYNSFFRQDSDADYAISLLPICDGIGVQLHLATWTDLEPIFARVRRMAAIPLMASMIISIVMVFCPPNFWLKTQKPAVN